MKAVARAVTGSVAYILSYKVFNDSDVEQTSLHRRLRCVICYTSDKSRKFPSSLIALARNCKLVILLYIELIISFLIGQKRTVNFRNQIIQ